MESIPIYIGYDPREASAYYVCQQSIIEHCKNPERLEFHPITGERRDGSNDFIYARFLVPYRQDFRGHAIFLDGDMLLTRDIQDLWDLKAFDAAVQVVKHDYKTKYPVKYLGNKNEDYPRKNWSSVMLWNCGFYPNRCLTPEYVAEKDGAHLHRFAWLQDDRIHALPAKWNHLTMEYDEKDAALYHFTVGIPPFYPQQEKSVEWVETFGRIMEPMRAD